ncbi:hypothetical protein ElyMa_000165700 [Elysia marginata]|uniref:Uncharacterized protein n=1 Tax=Elysia marginata TaxID=1093978 RepID=A0AAV4ETN9_9GAST|nr:hypothetical protein ElyMa_000165700 [Elysia marginata]
MQVMQPQKNQRNLTLNLVARQIRRRVERCLRPSLTRYTSSFHLFCSILFQVLDRFLVY